MWISQRVVETFGGVKSTGGRAEPYGAHFDRLHIVYIKDVVPFG